MTFFYLSSLKTKVKRLENFLDLWRNIVDQASRNIDQTLGIYKSNLFDQVNFKSNKFSPIGDGQLDYLLEKEYDTSKLSLNFTFGDLKQLESAVENFEKNLNLLNDDYSSLFAYSSLAAGGSSSTSMTTSATSSTTTMSNFITDVIEAYSLNLDKYKSELEFLYRLLQSKEKSSAKAQLESMSSTSTIPKIAETSELNETSNSADDDNFKSHHQEQVDASKNGAEMPKLELDFGVFNDSYDGKFQMTSTPRYGIQKAESSHKTAQPANYLLSATTQTSVVEPPAAKTFCDKSMATVDDKSSQTDFPESAETNGQTENPEDVTRTVKFKSISTPSSKNVFVSDKLGQKKGDTSQLDEKAFRSMDSGIQTAGSGAALNKTNATSSSDLDAASHSLPFSYKYEFDDKKADESSGEFEADLQHLDSSSSGSSAKNESEKSDSATLEHHRSQTEESVGTAASTARPSSTRTNPVIETPEDSFETELNDRSSRSAFRGHLLTPNTSTETDDKIEPSPEVDKEDQLQQEIDKIAASCFSDECLRREARATFNLKTREQIQINQPVPKVAATTGVAKRPFSKKFIIFSIFLVAFIGILMSMLLNFLSPGCCDHRRQTLVFNEKSYIDDESLIPC